MTCREEIRNLEGGSGDSEWLTVLGNKSIPSSSIAGVPSSPRNIKSSRGNRRVVLITKYQKLETLLDVEERPFVVVLLLLLLSERIVA